MTLILHDTEPTGGANVQNDPLPVKPRLLVIPPRQTQAPWLPAFPVSCFFLHIRRFPVFLRFSFLRLLHPTPPRTGT